MKQIRTLYNTDYTQLTTVLYICHSYKISKILFALFIIYNKQIAAICSFPFFAHNK